MTINPAAYSIKQSYGYPNGSSFSLKIPSHRLPVQFSPEFWFVVVLLLNVARQAVIDLRRITERVRLRVCVVAAFLVDINAIAQSEAVCTVGGSAESC